MAIFITVVVIILAVAGYAAYKIGAPDLDKIKASASQALDKIEPAIQEAEEVIEKAAKEIPANKVSAEVKEEVTAAKTVVKKVKTAKKSK